MLRLGFGFVEVGTLTPRPQAGQHSDPRLFRLREDGAVINRLGFNNEGYERARTRLTRRPAGLIGVNVGANKDAADRIEDYVLGVKTFAPVADYVAINISSPNTPGLRDLQRREALDELVARVAGPATKPSRAGQSSSRSRRISIAMGSTTSSQSCSRAGSMALLFPIQLSLGRHRCARSIAVRRAACRAGHSTSRPPGCWRGPMSRSAARSR